MHRLKRHLLLCLLMTGLLLTGCEIVNPSEDLPAYISFQNPTASAVDDTSFRTTAGIRNIWLYHGGFLQGAYQTDPNIDTTGRTIPIVELDRSDFFMEGGVYESGQSSFQIPYPFWDRVSFNWQATGGDTLVVSPVFHYVNASLYDLPVSVTFEGGGIDFDAFSSSLSGDSTFFKLRDDDVFHGNGAALVEFGPGNRFFEVVNSVPFRSVQASNIFAEITYKNDIPFTVGLVYGSVNSPNRAPILTISPSAEWNTVYVHMITEVRNILNVNGTDTDLWLWIKADGENKQGSIRFDDIRVIKEK